MLKKAGYFVFLLSFLLSLLQLSSIMTYAQDIDDLIRKLKDPHWSVRMGAAEALGEIKDPRATEPLIAALRDKDLDVRWRASDALGNIGKPAIQPLVAALSHLNIRMWAALPLLRIGRPEAKEKALSTVKTATGKDLETIFREYKSLIRKGKAGTEILLIMALEEYGNSSMAVDFLNCGNKALEAAATSWARRHGYEVVRWPGSHGGPVWGR